MDTLKGCVAYSMPAHPFIFKNNGIIIRDERKKVIFTIEYVNK